MDLRSDAEWHESGCSGQSVLDKVASIEKERQEVAIVTKGALVVTTIFDPVILESYYENFEQYGHLADVKVFVIPDRKTPAIAYERCELLRKRGLNVICPNLEEQEAYLRRVNFPPHLVPFNSDNRRNVGFLMALEYGADVVFSIDDDNYCRAAEDFFVEHAVVCQGQRSAAVVNSSTGWFNICSLMTLDRPGDTYARGFPYHKRHLSEEYVFSRDVVDVHMNAGLWLLDPDVDAISWLVAPAHTLTFRGESLVLGDHAWSPVNTQNTGLRREVVASYYYVKMGYPLAGMPIDRYGDIYSGYFAHACVRHMSGAVRVGTPVAEHRRNSHNYLNDATSEWANILVLEDMLPWLTTVQLSGRTYPEAYVALSYAIEDAVEHFRGAIWTDATRGYFHQVAYCMRHWANTCVRLL